MQSVDLESWSDFGAAISEFRERYRLAATELGEPDILFRGHSVSTWPLQTTLERMSPREYSARDYVLAASKCGPQLESLTGRSWGYNWFSLDEEVVEKATGLTMPATDYLIYLRHHGFPSPLLDWTRSPYVAAYFAFGSRPPAGTTRVAVYAFVERPRGVKMWSVGRPVIDSIGPYIHTDRRHFAQKAQYTYCTRFDHESGRHYFACHNQAIASSDDDQDVLCKFTIPATDRLSALRELGDYNIDAFTLFQDDDSLVRTLAIQELELDPQA